MIDGKIAVFLGFANDYSNTSNTLETLEEEEREIDNALDELRNSGQCHIIRGRALTPELFFEKLQKHRGEIDMLHFSGHAHEDALVLENSESEVSNGVSLQAYIDLIRNQAGNIKFLFLNGCQTIKQAKELTKAGVKAVIATINKIDEDDGLLFTSSFYKALSLGSSIQEAFNEAKGYLIGVSSSDEKIVNSWELVSLDDRHLQWIPFPKTQIRDSLNVLQLSDLNNSDFDFSNLEEFFANSESETDIILYTGNIISSANNLTAFKQTYQDLISSLTRITNVSPKNIFFSPGESDLDKTRILEAIHDKINQVKTNQEIMDFVYSGEQFVQSCNASSNFREVIKQNLNTDKKDILTELYSTHFREVAGKKIGVVCINSLWSSIDKDMDSLVFPIELLEDAYELVQASDYKILVSNLDFSALKPFNRKEVENLAYSKFDFLLLGASDDHTNNHKMMISNEGIYRSFSGLNQSKGIDFLFHKFCFNENKIDSHIRIYAEGNGCLVEEKDTQTYSFPRGIEKRKQVKLLQVLNKQLDFYHSIGDNLFVDYKREGKGFSDLFTQPVLREKPVEEIEALNNNSHFIQNRFKSLFELEKNFMLIGRDKSGKSSLLIFLATKILEDFSRKKAIPIYIDLKRFKNKVDKFDLLNYISSILERNKRETIGLFEKYHFKLLLDNFDPSNSGLTGKIKDFLIQNPSFTYILSTDQTAVRSYENLDFGFNHYTKLYIHEISRTEIRSLASKSIDGTDKYVEEVIQRLIKLFKQYRMPFNYWTVSVFLWILSKRKLEEFEIQNNSELIELYIQELLGQKELAYDTTNRFSFKKYKQFLSFLAWKLYKNHSLDGYSADYETLLSYTKEFIGRSRRNVAIPKDVIEYVLERGILKRVSPTHYSFRLNGAYEYFLAKEMLENEDFLNEVLNDDNVYISFKNELDLYSGFAKSDRKKDRELLGTVYRKTTEKFAAHNKRLLEEGTTDQNLVNKVGSKSILEIIQEVDIQKVTPLSYEQKDVIETELDEGSRSLLPIEEFNTEVKVKKQYDKTSNELEVLEDYLFIMSRVYRNVDVDDTEEEKLDDEILGFILDSTCNLGFLLLEEVTETLKSANEESSIFDNKLGLPKAILKIIGNILPLIVQDLFHQSVGHITLENVIKNQIDKLDKNPKENQLKLFILYFTLVDLDLKNIKLYVDRIFEITRNGIIKSSVLTKILFYLIFKSYNDTELTSFLRSKFRSYQMKLNPKTDPRELDKRLSEIDRLALIKRSSEKPSIK